eukprot:7246641-Alexandrium_andersonii.AAC.1
MVKRGLPTRLRFEPKAPHPGAAVQALAPVAVAYGYCLWRPLLALAAGWGWRASLTCRRGD